MQSLLAGAAQGCPVSGSVLGHPAAGGDEHTHFGICPQGPPKHAVHSHIVSPGIAQSWPSFAHDWPACEALVRQPLAPAGSITGHADGWNDHCPPMHATWSRQEATGEPPYSQTLPLGRAQGPGPGSTEGHVVGVAVFVI